MVTTHDATLTKDSISFGGLTYTWKAKDGKILFYDDADDSTDKKKSKKDKSGKKKEPAITMVPVEE